MSDYRSQFGPMPGAEPMPGEEPRERRQELGSQASERAAQVQRRARSLGHQLRRGGERARVLTAEGLSRAASTMRGASTAEDAPARRFAESMERSATYLRHTDLTGMGSDAVTLVKRYPAQALGVAFVVGVLVGQRYSRR